MVSLRMLVRIEIRQSTYKCTCPRAQTLRIAHSYHPRFYVQFLAAQRSIYPLPAAASALAAIRCFSRTWSKSDLRKSAKSADESHHNLWESGTSLYLPLRRAAAPHDGPDVDDLLAAGDVDTVVDVDAHVEVGRV